MKEMSSQEESGVPPEMALSLNPRVKLVSEGNHGYLYDHENVCVKVANRTALHILELCDEEHSINDIIKDLTMLYPDIPQSKLEKDVTHFIADLVEKGVVVFL